MGLNVRARLLYSYIEKISWQCLGVFLKRNKILNMGFIFNTARDYLLTYERNQINQRSKN